MTLFELENFYLAAFCHVKFFYQLLYIIISNIIYIYIYLYGQINLY